MRIQLVLCASLLLPSCLWTDFDDLEEDTWVHSTGKPDNASTNWAVAVARVARTGDGGRLAVLGASASLYNDIVIDPTGEVTITSEVELGADFAIGTLALEPLLLANPAADQAALVTGTGGDAVTTLVSAGGQLSAEQAFGPKIPSAATFMVPPLMAGGVGPSQTLVAENDTVYGTVFDAGSGFVQPECQLADETGAVFGIRALGAIRNGMTDDVVVLSDSGKLMVYDGGVFNGCVATQGPLTGKVVNLGFTGALPGSQIIPFSDDSGQYVLVQAHNDAGEGIMTIYEIDTIISAIGSPVTGNRLKTAALLDGIGSPAKRYVAVGSPATVVDGVTAGQVQVFEVSTTSGISATAAATLHDAQPGDNQSFGRGVAALPFNGKTILAVAADNDVYLYFRTTLYDETRQGR